MNAPHFSITTLFQQLNKVSNECSLRQVYASRCYSLCRSIASFNCPDRSIAFMVSVQIQVSNTSKHKSQTQVVKYNSQTQVPSTGQTQVAKYKYNKPNLLYLCIHIQKTKRSCKYYYGDEDLGAENSEKERE